MALTVTATQSGSPATGMGVRIRVLTGAKPVASQTGGSASAHPFGTGAFTASVTTTQTGSRVYGAIEDQGIAGTLTPVASTTLVDNFADGSNSDNYLSIKGTATTGTPGATSFGVNDGNTNTGNIAFLEILTAGALAEEPSSPAFATTTNASNVTTASFAPPPGSLLVAMIATNGGTAVNSVLLTDNMAPHLNWTEMVKSNPSAGDYAGVWIADVPPFIYTPGPHSGSWA